MLVMLDFLLGATCVQQLGGCAVLLLQLLHEFGQRRLGEHGADLGVAGFQPRQHLGEQLVRPFGAPRFACAVADPFADAMRHPRGAGHEYPVSSLAACFVSQGVNDLPRVLGIIDIHNYGVHETSLKLLRGVGRTRERCVRSSLPANAIYRGLCRKGLGILKIRGLAPRTLNCG